MTPVMTGVAFLPLNLALLPTSIATGVVISRTGRFQIIVWFGWAVITLANGVLILLGPTTKTVAWVFMFIVAGFGQGIIVTGLVIAVQASVESKYAAEASAIYTFVRSLGMALGVGIGGAAFQNRLSHQLRSVGLPTSISQDAEGFVRTMSSLPASEHEFVVSVIEAFARAFRDLFILSTAVAAAALLTSFLIRQSDMNVALNSTHVLRKQPDGAQEEVVEMA